MRNATRIRDQLQRNVVALISLVVAVTSLGYNTWRNEASEHNRNQRQLSIEVLRSTAQLQQVVFHNTWDGDVQGRGNPRTGWVHVMTIRDLASILDEDVKASAGDLYGAWENGWERLEPHSEAYIEIIAALEAVRADTHALLSDLD